MDQRRKKNNPSLEKRSVRRRSGLSLDVRDVLLTLAQMTQPTPERCGMVVSSSHIELAQRLGWELCVKSYKRILASLTRLKNLTVIRNRFFVRICEPGR